LPANMLVARAYFAVHTRTAKPS